MGKIDLDSLPLQALFLVASIAFEVRRPNTAYVVRTGHAKHENTDNQDKQGFHFELWAL
jgi:hypothetical protein